MSSGGSAYIVEELYKLDYSSLKEEVIKNEIEVLSMPFSALSAFCIETEIENVEHHNINYIISTAEQLYVNDHLRKFLEKNPIVELHNHYGPSETHVVTSYKMSKEMGNIESRSSIGKPISNTRIYILDTLYNLVPEGVKGELYIGGDNLATGYLNKEELTKERFIKDPFKQGEFLYKTGDQGYWRADGNIEYIGRKDDQVKIRGYRIELGEIEQALMKNEQIDEVVVLAKENKNNERELIAYITSREEQNTTELRTYLKKVLPNYMIPTFYVQMDEFPLTPNGKIDKKLLPYPKGLELKSGIEYLAPRNEIEDKLIEILSNLLDKPKNLISVNDNFFDLGVSSIKLIRLLNLVNKQFNKDLKVVSLFEYSTVNELASYLFNKSNNNTDIVDEDDISTAMDEMIDLM